MQSILDKRYFSPGLVKEAMAEAYREERGSLVVYHHLHGRFAQAKEGEALMLRMSQTFPFVLFLLFSLFFGPNAEILLQIEIFVLVILQDLLYQMRKCQQ